MSKPASEFVFNAKYPHKQYQNRLWLNVILLRYDLTTNISIIIDTLTSTAHGVFYISAFKKKPAGYLEIY